MSSSLMLLTGHRGFKHMFPENTLLAFSEAVDNGAKVIETDTQLTADGVVVISHDASTQRVFGEELVIQETEFAVLAGLKTLQEPHEPMPTLDKTLVWAQAQHRNGKPVKLMLDIKRVNPVQIVGAILEGLERNGGTAYWHDKVVFGLWTPEFLEAAATTHGDVLKLFEVIVIGLSAPMVMGVLAAAKSCAAPGDSNSEGKLPISGVLLFLPSTWDPLFVETRQKLLQRRIGLYIWTVNSLKAARWSQQLECKGIITDKVDLIGRYLEGAKEVSLDSPPVYGFASPLTGEGLHERGLYYLFKTFEVAITTGAINWGVGKFTLGRALFVTAQKSGFL